MDQQLKLLEDITKYLLSINTAAPLIFGTVQLVAGLFRTITGSGVTVLEAADIVERNLDMNDTAIRDEIARLRAKLGI